MLEENVFRWLEKSNIVPILKRDSKNLIKKLSIYQSPNFQWSFWKDLYSLLYYFIQNKPFTECQSGFISGDSFVAQILLVTHQIYKSFDFFFFLKFFF